jgi:hypothetical protein
MAVTTTTSSRRCERKPKTIPVSLVLKGGPAMSDGSAFTLDISLRGARVRTKLPLFPGELVGVVPKGDIPHAIPARAVWVREDEYMWTYAGLEFLDTVEAKADGIN